MGANGQVRAESQSPGVLRWPSRVVTAEELRRGLNGHRELLMQPKAIVTPLAEEYLRSLGVRLIRSGEESQKSAAVSARWAFAQERPFAAVEAVVQAMRRELISFEDWGNCGRLSVARWAGQVAEQVVRQPDSGVVVFCEAPALVCCVANKVADIRAAGASTAAQALQATKDLGANLLAVEMPGRTFFEVRQILRTVSQAGRPACPRELADILGKLETHAHR
jgi:ribose 5-phosphate isomerase RpiB